MAIENMRDNERTRQAYESGELRHPKKESYISNAGHYYLFGPIDCGKRWHEIYERDAGRCQKCGKWVSKGKAELSHKQGGLGPQRCWCAHNLEILCRPCHIGPKDSEHPGVQLGTIPGIRGLER